MGNRLNAASNGRRIRVPVIRACWRMMLSPYPLANLARVLPFDPAHRAIAKGDVEALRKYSAQRGEWAAGFIAHIFRFGPRNRSSRLDDEECVRSAFGEIPLQSQTHIGAL